MFQIRLHGRGGQGVVTAAEMLAVAGFYSDLYSQSFPSFGSERMGAPIMAFCRFHDQPIRLREPVLDPDFLWIQDDSLVHDPALFQGLKPRSVLLINSRKSLDELHLSKRLEDNPDQRVFQLPATELGREYLGRPVPNAAMLGAFTALYTPVSLAAVERALKERFAEALSTANYQAALAGHSWISTHDSSLQGGSHVEAN